MTLYAAIKSFSSTGVALTADFGRPAPAGTTPDDAIAAATLLADGTPGYAGPDSGTDTTTGPAAFGLWFHSTDPSRLAASAAAQVLVLQLVRNAVMLLKRVALHEVL